MIFIESVMLHEDPCQAMIAGVFPLGLPSFFTLYLAVTHKHE